jgi:hypothetical protein
MFCRSRATAPQAAGAGLRDEDLAAAPALRDLAAAQGPPEAAQPWRQAAGWEAVPPPSAAVAETSPSAAIAETSPATAAGAFAEGLLAFMAMTAITKVAVVIGTAGIRVTAPAIAAPTL